MAHTKDEGNGRREPRGRLARTKKPRYENRGAEMAVRETAVGSVAAAPPHQKVISTRRS